MSGYKLKDGQNYLAPCTPDGEEDGADVSELEIFETPAARSVMEQSWSNVKPSPNQVKGLIEESIQEYSDDNSVEEEDSQISIRSDNSDNEITEDEVDKSQASYRENRSTYTGKKGTKQQARHRHNVFIENSEDESGDDSDKDVSYHVRGQRLGSDEKYSTIGDPDESYQVFKAGRHQGKLVIRSSEENSAEPSEVEELVISKSKESDRSSKSSLSSEDSFRFSGKKKARKPIDSDSDSSVEGTPLVRQKAAVIREDSDSSDEATPHAHRGSRERKAVLHVESGDEDTEEEIIIKKTPRNQHKFVDSDASTEEEFESTRFPSSSRIPTPRMIQNALLATSRDRHDSGNDSNMDPLNGTHEMSRKSADKRFSPPETLAEEVSIQDLSNSILEVSSTVVSFSSPEVEEKEQDQSITEIVSPESARAPPAVARLSEQEVVQLRDTLNRQKLILKSSNLKSLPDGGARIRENIRVMTERLEAAIKLGVDPPVRPVPVSSASSVPSEVQEDELRKKLQMKKWAMGNANAVEKERLRGEISAMERRLIQLSIANATNAGSSSYSSKHSDFQNEMQNRSSAEKQTGIKLLPDLPKLTDMQKKMFADNAGKELYKKTESGYISAAARREAVSITMDSLENLHRSLASCPKESDKESTPSCLTVNLMAHQERALKWLLWRETQVPAGGILADDMGLGKTLTMISLIVRQKELDPPPPASSDIWLSKTVKIKRSSGTLVVCPASVVGQWEKEIQRRCKRNSLSIVIFHGPDRNKFASKLHQYDIVITTYQIVSREISNVSLDKKDCDSRPIGDFNVETDAAAIRQSVLLQIAFDRIILDEAHVIRNPKAGISQAVCRLRASRRWVVTGTPVQNKELDMYSLLRFLRVTPFDQLAVWKRWVDSSKAKNDTQAQGRLQLLIKTLLLRRTKDQKVEGSETPLVEMPAREVHTHQVQLSQEENQVYQKLLAFSRKALEEYIKNQENKIKEGYGFTYDRSNLPELPQKNVTKQMMLVLLLRLRQVCSHPALIQTMLDATETDALGSEDAKIEENDLDLITQMSTMKLGDEPNEPKKEEENFFTHTNPVFDRENMSSKMRYIIDEIKKVVSLKQKAVVVSQWTSMLDLFAQHFRRLRIRCHLIAGSVAIKHRTEIVEDFNRNPDGPPVILLSLGAGGVGLNLIGGNHIFIADMHWNPQLEAQACDRVYRVGQTKDVHVHRMITQGTVEERILQLQQSKLAMANGILTGAAKLATKGLTIDDLKMLFNPGPPPYAPKPMLNPPEF